MTSGLVLTDITIALNSIAPTTGAGGQRRLIDHLTLTVAPGEVGTLMGPSGSGKSTLLAYVAGFLAPGFTASGGVSVAGRDLLALTPARRSVGLVFQDDLLFAHMTVGENLGFGLKKRPRESRSDRMARIEQALAAAELTGYAKRRPQTLSGGQRARVSLLRSLLAEPSVLLLDEPFSKLDTALRGTFRRFVFDQIRARAIPALMVTHDLADTDGATGPVVTLT